MLSIDEKRLEAKLLEVLKQYYSYISPYLVIESINVIFDESESTKYSSFSYDIKGRAGDECSENSEIRFDILIDPKWSTEFMQGYFYRVLEDLQR